MDYQQYGLTADHQIELGDNNKAFWEAIKKAERKFGEGKQAFWEAGLAAKEMRSLVPHGHWEDYCRHVLGHDPAWIWRLIRFSESCSYLEASNVSSIRAYLAPGQDLGSEGHLDPNDEYAPSAPGPSPNGTDSTHVVDNTSVQDTDKGNRPSSPPYNPPPTSQNAGPEQNGLNGHAGDPAAPSGEIEVDVEDVTDQDVKPDVQAKPKIGGRLSATDKLQLELDAVNAERDALADRVDELTAQLKVAQETLAQVEYEKKPGGAMGKSSIGDQIGSLNLQLRDKDSELKDAARREADLKDELNRYRRVNRKVEKENEELKERRNAQLTSVQGELDKVRDLYEQGKLAFNEVRQTRDQQKGLLQQQKTDIEDLEAENEELTADLDYARDRYKDLVDIIVRNDLEHILPEAE